MSYVYICVPTHVVCNVLVKWTKPNISWIQITMVHFRALFTTYIYLKICIHDSYIYREKLKRKFMAGANDYDRKVVFGTQHLQTTTRTWTTFQKVWNFPCRMGCMQNCICIGKMLSYIWLKICFCCLNCCVVIASEYDHYFDKVVRFQCVCMTYVRTFLVYLPKKLFEAVSCWILKLYW